MRRALLVLVLLATTLPARATQLQATGTELTSKLAPVMLRGSAQVPQLWLAQRSIDRQWGVSEDSTYRTIDVQGWKSEGLALALSSAVPGAGQLYAGEGSGWVYMVSEALGWAGRVITRHRGNQLRDQAATFVGDPTDSTSTWSFARYASASGGAATLLEQLWAGDRESFYQALATDLSYRPGFSGSNPSVAFESYRGLRESSQNRFRQSRVLEMALWVNHAVSAFDALRAAHFHNLPLRHTIDLQLGGGVRRGEPQFRAALVRRF